MRKIILTELPEAIRSLFLPKPNRPIPVISAEGNVVAVVMHPDQYASMIDQIQDGKMMSLAVQKLTGTTDPAKLSLPDFLEVYGLTDEYLDAVCEGKTNGGDKA